MQAKGSSLIYVIIYGSSLIYLVLAYPEMQGNWTEHLSGTSSSQGSGISVGDSKKGPVVRGISAWIPCVLDRARQPLTWTRSSYDSMHRTCGHPSWTTSQRGVREVGHSLTPCCGATGYFSCQLKKQTAAFLRLQTLVNQPGTTHQEYFRQAQLVWKDLWGSGGWGVRLGG